MEVSNTGTGITTYWHKLLADFTVTTPLPAAHHQPTKKTTTKKSIAIKFSTKLCAQLNQFAEKQKLTPEFLLEAAWGLLLARYTNTDDIVFGVTRGANKLLPIRIKLDAELTVRHYLKQLNKQNHESNKFAAISLKQIQQYSELDANTPLFSTIITFKPLNKSTYPLSLNINIKNKNISCQLIYSVNHLNSKLLKPLLTHYQNLITSICQYPNQTVVTLPMLTQQELDTLLIKWNNTKADYPKDKTIHQLFEEQVAKTPNNIAVVFEEKQLTYRELNKKANQLAHYLRKQGVKPETLVAICIERSLEMIIGILGILKAGGAYVPIDPHYPEARIQYMLEDSSAPIVLTHNILCRPVSNLLQKSEKQPQLICLNDDWSIIKKESSDNPKNLTKPDNLIYVIYTSGTTGKPKGVCNIHSGSVNRITWMQNEYKLKHTDRVLQKTPFTFDVSVWEFFWPLITGACLVVAKPRVHQELCNLIYAISSQNITVLHFVPSMLRMFINETEIKKCKTLRKVFSSGETLTTELQENFFKKLNAKLYNLYGPTEASIDVTYWQCEKNIKSKNVPIGKPIANTQIYILDKYSQPTPIGINGEIHIGGTGLARGYLNPPNLTQEKFILNKISNGKLYKTGDLGHWRDDGNMEYIGRLDDQIKIRGIRIESEEIETVLLQYPGVTQASIFAEKTKDTRLIACVTSSDISFCLKTENVRTFLKQKLPEYMMPSSFFVLQNFPLQSNGKIDKRKLSEIIGNMVVLSDNYVPPKNPVQKQLNTLWCEVLNKGSKEIGIYDNFFDVGGYSLLANQVMAKVYTRFGVNVAAHLFAEAPTIAAMSDLINQKLNCAQKSAEQVDPTKAESEYLITA
jgi:amino acid adenylation domain-containing protein